MFQAGPDVPPWSVCCEQGHNFPMLHLRVPSFPRPLTVISLLTIHVHTAHTCGEVCDWAQGHSEGQFFSKHRVTQFVANIVHVSFCAFKVRTSDEQCVVLSDRAIVMLKFIRLEQGRRSGLQITHCSVQNLFWRTWTMTSWVCRSYSDYTIFCTICWLNFIISTEPSWLSDTAWIQQTDSFHHHVLFSVNSTVCLCFLSEFEIYFFPLSIWVSIFWKFVWT